jgi:nitrite reductase/ring-hydroxylating ferredoxin subunit
MGTMTSAGNSCKLLLRRVAQKDAVNKKQTRMKYVNQEVSDDISPVRVVRRSSDNVFAISTLCQHTEGDGNSQFA